MPSTTNVGEGVRETKTPDLVGEFRGLHTELQQPYGTAIAVYGVPGIPHNSHVWRSSELPSLLVGIDKWPGMPHAVEHENPLRKNHQGMDTVGAW